MADKGDVVLFFKASWCPTCKALDGDIKANMGSIPSGVTILEVNYDTETALKQKYAVTYQHTLVQVDSKGAQIAKWSGSPTLTALASKIQ
jgi:thiol-disulfide isomerase/thioredoxin